MTSPILILSLGLLHWSISPAWSQDMPSDVMEAVGQVQDIIGGNMQGPQSSEYIDESFYRPSYRGEHASNIHNLGG
ncbi:uncharacterized protein LOC6726350 isoform X2 [Drosophila simulans]|uniref:uncharacterized protein LOC6726350 isoform X2 n=1 Tax=Drosophila simulans TaxID=7240 RepID=UPI00078AE296|nr:uncharacterized protein LOC6726350 isoform X2 [Drosophila simulans]KMZ10504.1 uncharacterized protein Dsimw501_GD17396, isoform B [Drosophila simulans]